jgi:DNA-binding GntR family transcriptional regulator
MTTISAGSGAGAEPAGSRHVKRPTPLRESVYEALTEMIIDGTLERGRHLVEVELAGLLGVSRQPVREALQRLNNEGWVDLRPGFGAMVHVPAEDEVDQLLAARAALESESARLAARHASKEDVAKLRELCKVGTAYQEAGDIDGAVRTNGELHSLITQMSGNRFLVDFAAQVDRRVRWYYTPVAPARGAASWREHSRLVKAISDGDEDRAAQVMREHTEHTRKAYHDLQATADPAATPAEDPAPRRRRRTN